MSGKKLPGLSSSIQEVCEFILLLFSYMLMVACQKIKVIKGRHASSRKGESNQMRGGTCWSYLRDSDFRPAQALGARPLLSTLRTLFSELLKPHRSSAVVRYIVGQVFLRTDAMRLWAPCSKNVFFPSCMLLLSRWTYIDIFMEI